MSAAPSALGALPARFRRHRVLVVGCGDVGLRLVRLMPLRGVHIMALANDAARAPLLRAHGLRALAGNLDDAASLRRLAGLAHSVIHLAPPASDAQAWWRDLRTARLLAALRRRSAPQQAVYVSTSGVYGDRQGAWTDETAPVRPQTPRAHRRADAEAQLRHWGRARAGQLRVRILRAPGIYAADRAASVRARLLRGTPVLAADEDVYTNHIHADDLARALWLALWRGSAQRIYNACDPSTMKMGDYFDMAAALYGLPPPPRLSLEAAQHSLPPGLLSFMQESRRLRNTRLERELRLRLRYPTPWHGLKEVEGVHAQAL